MDCRRLHTWFPGQLYIDAFSTIFPGQLHIDAFSTTVVSQSTLNQWLFNTLAMSPGNPNSNAYSIIKITIDQCCSNVYAINIDNIRFHRYCNDDSTFILRWNFNINHNDDSDEKSIFIQCLLAVWAVTLPLPLLWPLSWFPIVSTTAALFCQDQRPGARGRSHDTKVGPERQTEPLQPDPARH